MSDTSHLDDKLRFVDPDLREMAEFAVGPSGYPVLGPHNLAAYREGAVGGELETEPLDVSVEEVDIPGAEGHPPVKIYILNKGSKGEGRPALLHTHGGGFICWTAYANLPLLQKYCHALDCVVVTVEYRLAPETTYAGSLEDNYAGLKWLYQHADELGVDPGRIAVLGESAGGGHAALLAIAARDRKEVPLAFQCLIDPMLDDRTGSSREPLPHTGFVGWTAESNRFGWECFLGTEPGGDAVPEGAVPARVEDLSGLPPTFIGVGGLDLFVEEDIEYATRLMRTGIPVELLVVPGAFHGFAAIASETKPARRFSEAVMAALRRGLGIPD